MPIRKCLPCVLRTWIGEYTAVSQAWHCSGGKKVLLAYDPDTKVFEAYVQNRTPGAYRIFWCYGPKQGENTIIAITPNP